MLKTLILAAGSSRRMGTDKLLLPLGQQTMLEVVTHKAVAAGLKPWVVVSPANAAAICKLLGEQVPLILAPEAHLGQAHSLKAGLSHLLELELQSPALQGVMVILGDQPGIASHTLQALVQAFTKHPEAAIAPSYAGQRGNPVILPCKLFPQILKLTGDRGAKHLIADCLHLVPVDDKFVLLDLDTKAAYEEYHALHSF